MLLAHLKKTWEICALTLCCGELGCELLSIDGKELVCVLGCVFLWACLFGHGDRNRDSSFLYTLCSSKGLCPLERETVYFLTIPFVKYCHSVGWSTNANLLPDCRVVICIPNQTAAFHYKLLIPVVPYLEFVLLLSYSFPNNDPWNNSHLKSDSHLKSAVLVD